VSCFLSSRIEIDGGVFALDNFACSRVPLHFGCSALNVTRSCFIPLHRARCVQTLAPVIKSYGEHCIGHGVYKHPHEMPTSKSISSNKAPPCSLKSIKETLVFIFDLPQQNIALPVRYSMRYAVRAVPCSVGFLELHGPTVYCILIRQNSKVLYYYTVPYGKV
jgi:hypothetical protein